MPQRVQFFYAVNHMPDAGQGSAVFCVVNYGTAAAITAVNKKLSKTFAPTVR